MKTSNRYALAGDIGGTNTRLALYRESRKTTSEGGRDQENIHAVHVEEFRNLPHVKEHGPSAFNTILENFLDACLERDGNMRRSAEDGTLVIVACLACAGPIIRNACEFTNIDNAGDGIKFSIKGDDIVSCTKGRERFIKVCKIVNDFVGQGYGALTLDLSTEVVELTPGSANKIDPSGPKVCVGAGTGLGECFLTTNSSHPEVGYECFPSEGGHVEYSPRSELEVELWQFLMKKFSHDANFTHRISVERIVSGKGLSNVYEFLSKKFPNDVDPQVHADFLSAGDMQGKVVGENATPGSLCDRAVDIFVGAYGSEVGSAALKWIPRGGLYVTGGIIGKHMEKFPEKFTGEDSPFMRAFHGKGRVSPILRDVPLFAVKTGDMGLRGARFVAMRELSNFECE